ncbi:hypothetical protein MYX06_03060 [Patescibacteria group bacterium AH-259-L05]|nr:hypothetical protein [Patescibacteria group bacterium AH-259-L05]
MAEDEPRELGKAGKLKAVYFMSYDITGVSRRVDIDLINRKIILNRDRSLLLSVKEKQKLTKLIHDAHFFQLCLLLFDRWKAREKARKKGEVFQDTYKFFYGINVKTNLCIYGTRISDTELCEFPKLQLLIEWLAAKSFPIGKVKKMLADEQWLIEEVIKGNKPGCEVYVSEEARRFAKTHGLVVISESDLFGRVVVTPDRKLVEELNALNISQPVPLSSLPIVDWLRDFSEFPFVQKQAERLFKKIDSMVIAQALAYLCEYPKITDERELFYKGKVKPEVDLLFGLLFGYRTCCIRYYLATRCFGKERYQNESNTNEQGFYNGVLCEECTTHKKKD